jgi:hypothetical protein
MIKSRIGTAATVTMMTITGDPMKRLRPYALMGANSGLRHPQARPFAERCCTQAQDP